MGIIEIGLSTEKLIHPPKIRNYRKNWISFDTPHIGFSEMNQRVVTYRYSYPAVVWRDIMPHLRGFWKNSPPNRFFVFRFFFLMRNFDQINRTWISAGTPYGGALGCEIAIYIGNSTYLRCGHFRDIESMTHKQKRWSRNFAQITKSDLWDFRLPDIIYNNVVKSVWEV